jgi:glycosyltransferase involved in cell wall biosynthesis
VLLAPGAKFAAAAREMGVTVHEAPLRRWWRPDLWWKTRAAYRRVQPDVVHFACGRSLLLAGLALRGMPAKKFTIRRIDYPIAKGWRGGARYTRLVDHTIAICDAIRRRLIAAGVPNDRITLVYDGIDPRPWTGLQDRKAAARARLGIAADAQVVSCAGILRPRKGQHVLIDAFARLANDFPRAVLFLAGGGSEHERLRAQAARLGLAARVFLPGPVKPVFDVYAASDLFVMPSFHEGSVQRVPRSRLRIAAAGGQRRGRQRRDRGRRADRSRRAEGGCHGPRRGVGALPRRSGARRGARRCRSHALPREVHDRPPRSRGRDRGHEARREVGAGRRGLTRLAD